MSFVALFKVPIKIRLSELLKYSAKKYYFSTMPAKTALVFLPEGAEEMEAVISIDVLRRGGVDVTVAGVPDATAVNCSRKVNILPDLSLSDAISRGPYDAIVLPGGLGGAKILAENKQIGDIIKEQEKAGRITAAICAAPTALKAHGTYSGKNLTSYPAMAEKLKEGGQYNYKEDTVVVDGTLITSRGPGTAFDFALTIVDKLEGKAKATEVAKGMLLTY